MSFVFIQPKMLSVRERDNESPTETTDVIICIIFGVSFPEKSKPKSQTQLHKYKVNILHRNVLYHTKQMKNYPPW